MTRAMIFLAKAQGSSWMDSLSAEQQRSIRGMAGSDGVVVQELMQPGTVEHLEVLLTKLRKGSKEEQKKARTLLTKLFKGSEEEKEKARTEVREMKTDEEDLKDSMQDIASDVLKNLEVASEKEGVCDATSMLQLSDSGTKLALHAIADAMFIDVALIFLGVVVTLIIFFSA